MNCTNCGAPLVAGTNRCRKCGTVAQTAEAPVFAATTGSPPQMVVVQTAPAGTAPKSKVVAGLLGIFLGGLGVHRFYLGYTGIGAIQLVLTLLGCLTVGITLMISVVWGIIEGIMILAGAINRDRAGQALQ